MMFVINVTVSYGEERPIRPTYKRGYENEGGFNRSPLYLPIEIILESSNGILTIISDEEIKGEVDVYNTSGSLVASAKTINTQLSLPTKGYFFLVIQGENWLGETSFIY